MILRFEEFIKESLPQQSTVDQLKNIQSVIDKELGGDIGDKISDMNKQGANIQYIQNPIKTGIQSIQDYERDNKNFDVKSQAQRMKPFKNFQMPQHTSHQKKKKTK